MANTDQAAGVPLAMQRKLRQIRLRHILFILLRALALSASVLIIAMMIAMIIDWGFVLFSTGTRATLTALALGLAAAALIATAIPAVARILRASQPAMDADRVIPELQERWTTVMDFAASPHKPHSPAGKAMLRQVTSEAIALGVLVQPQRIVRPQVLRPSAYALCGTVLLLSGFLAIDWPQTRLLLQRFWAPTANITATQLESVNGDVTIARHEPLELVIRQTGLHRRSGRLTIQYGSGAHDTFELDATMEQPQRFMHAMRVAEPFRYRLQAGDARTPWYDVTVIDYPTLAEFQMQIVPPEYVDRPPYQRQTIPSRVRAIAGSRLTLRMKPAAPLQQLTLAMAIGGDDHSEEQRLLSPDADGWYHFESQLLDNLAFTPRLLSPQGLTDEIERTCQIEVIRDQAPVARMISSTEQMVAAADDVIEVRFEAHDDFGIQSAELIVYDETQEDETPRIVAVQEIPLGDQQGKRHVMMSTSLDLNSLALREGANISYAVRVTDNRMVQRDAEHAEMPSAAASDQASQAAGSAPDAGEVPAEHDAAENMLAETQPQMGSDALPPGPADPQAAPSPPPDALTADAGSGVLPSVGNNSEVIDEMDTASTNAAAVDTPEPATNAAMLAASEPGEADVSRAGADASAGSEKPRPPQPRDQPALSDETDVGEPLAEASARSSPASTGDAEFTKPANQSRSATDSSLHQSLASESPVTESDTDGVAQSASQTSTEAAMDQPSQTAGLAEERDINTTADHPAIADVPVAEGSHETDLSPSDTRSLTEHSAEPQTAADNDQGESKSSTDQPDEFAMSEFVMNPQRGESGQNAETPRRRLKIAQRLTAVAAATTPAAESPQIRDRVVAIDQMLAGIEGELKRLVDRVIADAQRGAQFNQVDGQLGEVQQYIADLRAETKEQQFAFVGLQMVEIDRAFIAPARNQVFLATRDPNGPAGNSLEPLQHIVRAREELAALLTRYDRVARDRELAEELDETIEIYEVYVAQMQQLMRQRRQSNNPLQRKMGIIEVDQDYLDRYAEVLTLRRELMREFGRMLADDPRLLSRYLDLTKRRRGSFRDQLSELAKRQDEITYELSGWMAADPAQREDVWLIIKEMRSLVATDLARECAEFVERVENQLPLILDPEQATASAIIAQARDVAAASRAMAFDAERVFAQGLAPQQPDDLTTRAAALVDQLAELDARLDRLNFEHEDRNEVTSYVTARLLESRTVADRAEAWQQITRFVQDDAYHALAAVDQRRLEIETELLRVAMLEIQSDLGGEFQSQGASDVPAEIVEIIHRLHAVMEQLTLQQSAATFALAGGQLELAAEQQSKVLASFQQAEELFDQMRRAVIAALDEYDLENPNIAQLVDPTLDEFLARLEREPNIETQLGIPNRPRNLRVIADSLLWQQEGAGGLGDSSEAARARATDAMQMQPVAAGRRNRPDDTEHPSGPTDESREQQVQAGEMQDAFAKALANLQEQLQDTAVTGQERRKLEEQLQNLQRMLDQLGSPSADAQRWQRIADSDQAAAILRALAAGEALPDEQWNKLLSQLNEGLWQVQGRKPPEEYRRAIEQYQEQLRNVMSAPLSDRTNAPEKGTQ